MLASLIKKIFHKATYPTIDKEGAVVEPLYLDVNGTKQWVYARGENIDHPILLFLHAGPGLAATGVTNGYQAILERHFIVVNWHMRGSGKSFSKTLVKQKMTIDMVVDDAIEVSRQLIERYSKKNVYIMGHSFGSLIALKAVKKSPEIFKHFISIAQMTDVSEMEKQSYDYAEKCATQEGDNKSLKSLKKISRTVDNLTIDGIKKKQEIIHKFGGCAPGFSSILDLIKVLIINPVEHSFSDVINCFKGLEYSGSQLFKEACEVNFFEEIESVDVPVLMIYGDNDQISIPELVKSYFEKLNAPKKELIEIEKDAHFSFLSYPDVFQNNLLKGLNIIE